MTIEQRLLEKILRVLNRIETQLKILNKDTFPQEQEWPVGNR